MQPQGFLFINSSMIGSQSSAVTSWVGGRSTLVFAATQYGATVIPQLKAANGKWVPICSTVVSDQIFTFEAPPGQYCVVSTGSSINLSATITASY